MLCLNTSKHPERVVGLIVGSAFIVCLVVIIDTRSLFQYSSALGHDGYYYAVQVEAIIRHKQLPYPTAYALPFWFLALISRVVTNVIVATKVGALVTHLLFSVFCGGIVLKMTRSRSLAVFSLGVAGIMRFDVLFLTEFLRQFMGLTVLLGAVLLWISRRSWYFRGFSVLAVLASVFCHRSIAPCIVAVALVSLLFRWLDGRNIPRLAALALLVPLVWSCLYALEDGLFRAMPLWTAGPLPVWGIAEAILVVVIGCIAVMHRPELTVSSSRHYLVGASVAALGLVTVLGPDFAQDLAVVGARLRLLCFASLPLTLPLSLHTLSQKVGGIYLSFAILALSAFTVIPLTPAGITPSYMKRREELINSIPSLREELRSDCIVVAPHGDEFLVTFLLGRKAVHSIPTNASCVYLLVHSVPTYALAASMRPLAHDDDQSETVGIWPADLDAALRRSNESTRRWIVKQNASLRPITGE
jgi:hypothetical protein